MIPGNANPLLLASAAADAAAVEGPTKSLRFNSGDSAYLSKTFSSAGNRKKWTWSGWLKRTATGTNCLFSAQGSSNHTLLLFYGSTQKFAIVPQAGQAGATFQSNALHRDPSAWYHIVIALDTTQSTASNRLKAYRNGVEMTWSSSTYPSQNEEWNINIAGAHNIGRSTQADSYLDGYLADVHFIDGSQLEPTSFGAFDDNGVWQAATYSGTFGTNGFHLKFDDASSNAALGTDSSGNSNTWTVNNFLAAASGVSITSIKFDCQSNSGAHMRKFFIGSTAVTSSVYTTATNNISQYDSGHGSGQFPNAHDGNEATNLDWKFGDITYTFTNKSANYVEFIGHMVNGTVQINGTTYTPVASGTSSGGRTIYRITLVDPADVDSLFDAPTNGSQSDTGAGGEVSGNYATLNSLTPVARACTFSNGNLDVVIGTGFGSTNNDGIRAVSTIGMTSGKWYFEHEITGGSLARSNVGVVNDITTYGFGGNHWVGSGAGDYIVWSNTGEAYNSGSGSSYGVSWTTGDIIGCAFDADNGNLYVYKNGTVMNSGTAAFTGLTSGPYFFICAERDSNITANFGQRPFAYSAPSGYKALNTASMSAATIADGSTAFDAKLYTGDGTGQTITGLGFSPDLVWIKQRNATRFHVLFDTVRGANERLRANSTAAETTQTDHLSAFTSDGFTVQTSANVNASSGSYVAWAWDAGSSTASNTDGSITSNVRANQTAGFSIVEYTGNATNSTVGHGLNAAPELIIIKLREDASGWAVYHDAIGTSTNNYIELQSTAAAGQDNTAFQNTAPTSSVFSIGTKAAVNNSGDSHIAYCISPVVGYSAVGSYEGTGAADNFVYTGFRSRLVWIKEVDNANPWFIYDTVRNTYNTIDNILWANSSNSESTIGAGDGTNQNGLQILSNGFAIPHTLTATNRSGSTFIFCAWAENPFQANGGLAR